ncbi:MAG: 50S ribosomal protein L11 methyltransferase [Spirochaetales bacterium]|nr:50S ribosomal protein L11 methyltransferase [Leptospiraceae bacterium]MCP5482186.1 50S ribosomal protein L11 methyltransferase [Spirochaetales bacterium]MCP5484702.1 50S ribosomal protein L11 methyltransferase [Spirochaetales bacterium]
MSDPDLFIESRIELSRADAQSLVRVLDSSRPLTHFSGYYEVLYDEGATAGKDRTEIVLYFTPDAHSRRLECELLLAALDIEEYAVREQSVLRDDYLQAYREHYRSFPIGRSFLIVPSWEQDTRIEAGRRPIYLDPGLAFGTGQHATTALCLEYIEQYLPANTRLIDAGCGSGILSIAAALVGVRNILAFDVDSNAVQATRNNAAQNLKSCPDIMERIQVVPGGFELSEIEQFDATVLIGNLTANVIRANYAAIVGSRARRAVLSGILTDKEGEIIEIFASEWHLNQKSNSDGWSLLEFKRGADN